jgi:hypothetical protein
MYQGKFLEVDISELPLPFRVKGKNGKSKFYMLIPSVKTQGASMCKIEEPMHQLLLEEFNRQ